MARLEILHAPEWNALDPPLNYYDWNRLKHAVLKASVTDALFSAIFNLSYSITNQQ